MQLLLKRSYGRNAVPVRTNPSLEATPTGYAAWPFQG